MRDPLAGTSLGALWVEGGCGALRALPPCMGYGLGRASGRVEQALWGV